jgi:hypothetical protein
MRRLIAAHWKGYYYTALEAVASFDVSYHFICEYGYHASCEWQEIAVGFVPVALIRWRKRYFVVVDCDGMDTIIAREYGKGGFERIPISEALLHPSFSSERNGIWRGVDSFRPREAAPGKC